MVAGSAASWRRASGRLAKSPAAPSRDQRRRALHWCPELWAWSPRCPCPGAGMVPPWPWGWQSVCRLSATRPWAVRGSQHPASAERAEALSPPGPRGGPCPEHHLGTNGARGAADPCWGQLGRQGHFTGDLMLAGWADAPRRAPWPHQRRRRPHEGGAPPGLRAGSHFAGQQLGRWAVEWNDLAGGLTQARLAPVPPWHLMLVPHRHTHTHTDIP